MKIRWTALAITILATLTFSLGYPARVLADEEDRDGWVKSGQRFVLDANVFNGCNNGERVHIVGLGMISVLTRLNSDGTVEVKEHDEFIGSGTSAAGAKYVFNEGAFIDQSNGPNPDGTPFSYTEQRRQRLIGQGGVPDQVITFDIQLVIDGAGNVTVDIFDIEVECN